VTTGVVFNEGLIDFVCERIEAMTDDAIGAVLERR
jgi:hypothetical protein